MKKSILLLLLLITFIVSGCVNNQNSLEVVSTKEYSVLDYKGMLPNDYSQENLNEVVEEQFDEFVSLYFRTVPNNENQMYLDYIAGVRTDPNVTWANKKAVTTSESHGYGMLAIVQMAHLNPSRLVEMKEMFDKFYNLYDEFRSDGNENLMCWQLLGEGLNRDGSGEVTKIIRTNSGGSSATDGDMDMAYSLILADYVFGSNGRIDYYEAGKKMIEAIYESEVNHEEDIMLLGDWVKIGNFYKTTRASDFMVNHIKLFAEVDEKNSEGWNRVLDKMIEIIDYNANVYSNTGLLADFLKKDGEYYIPVESRVLEASFDGDYNWNSCRVPWRISINNLYTNDDRLTNSINTLNNFIKEKTNSKPQRINPGYYIRGNTTGTEIEGRNYESLSYISPFIVSAAVSEENREWFESLFSYIHSREMKDSQYFDNSITLHCYFVITGNYLSVEIVD